MPLFIQSLVNGSMESERGNISDFCNYFVTFLNMTQIILSMVLFLVQVQHLKTGMDRNMVENRLQDAFEDSVLVLSGPSLRLLWIFVQVYHCLQKGYRKKALFHVPGIGWNIEWNTGEKRKEVVPKLFWGAGPRAQEGNKI